MAILFRITWGIINGIERIVLSIIWPNYFGRKHLGSIKGAVMTATVVGSAFGPLPFGVAYDLFGGYGQIILLTIIIYSTISSYYLTSPYTTN
ncbi:MFS family permease [Evansella vedderi]|uniref:MFS family permease n=1 Tax=Evansella vedderi TaxID=38282 RepID=A0ABU0A4X1_9BACI|nr:hypothetical protein [Evansella vedderi]MDQ0258072.1 MFS family permease [Evansella vedderi]